MIGDHHHAQEKDYQSWYGVQRELVRFRYLETFSPFVGIRLNRHDSDGGVEGNANMS